MIIEIGRIFAVKGGLFRHFPEQEEVLGMIF